MKRRFKQACQAGAVLASLLAASLVSAHHSAAAFDAGAQKVITGTVQKFNWTNPHTWVLAGGAQRAGRCGHLGMSPNYLARRGWSKSTVKPGDKLSITIRPMKDGQKGGMWMSAKRPNGEVLMMSGEIVDP